MLRPGSPASAPPSGFSALLVLRQGRFMGGDPEVALKGASEQHGPPAPVCPAGGAPWDADTLPFPQQLAGAWHRMLLTEAL